MQGDLSDFLTFGKPGRLDVGNIVQVKTRSGEHSQVSRRSFADRNFLLKSGVARLKTPRNKRRKAAGFILQITHTVKMFEPIFRSIDVSIHHRCRRFKSEFVSLAMDLDTAVIWILFEGNSFADVFRKDFRAAAGK